MVISIYLQGGLLEEECLVGQVPVVGVLDIDPADRCGRRQTLVVVDENLARACLHGIVVLVADDQLEVGDRTQALVVCNLQGNFILFVLGTDILIYIVFLTFNAIVDSYLTVHIFGRYEKKEQYRNMTKKLTRRTTGNHKASTTLIFSVHIVIFR
jgi:hypothetical protein